ncbi:DUF805 domain-containing protein [Streptomyces sp. SID13666]|uniref:DUF805 domain-containing protein n=1 Tax=Streptomyces TaxID=1883 RepID=UPI0011064148|nr:MULTISPECIES: DUF805 domain-containing protein [Streptomyces]MCZ4096835.1 DUF805 domain-containing protein [Streptomyces sp. H39-C1]NEA56204.1 DUF805 domain-containing protein [Streptomyces sp. SID13666]NEA71875.1 DUF805 domain-containing protein [Streptomyces sp. SID13588]QNA77085.1 DUF805 domain-containing protein [Streptomyces sp. So13.3]
MHYYLDVLKKYAVFGGRARCREYWMFTLFHSIIIAALMILDWAIGSPWLVLVYIVPTFLPALGVTVRRLHDSGRRGWWVLLGAVPLIGDICLLVMLSADSEQQTNAFGPNPKAVPVRDAHFA